MGNKAIVVGWINKNKPADCGETMKNQLMIQKLEELGVKCYLADFKNWRKHPWVFLQLLWYFVCHYKASIILSSSAKNIYPLLRVLKILGFKRNVVHWVIGGNLNERICEGAYSVKILNRANHTLVETTKMANDLSKSGLKNVMCVPNFKPIDYLPSLSSKNKATVKRFVFISRIVPDKGVDYIIESANELNNMGLGEKFGIDFYGRCSNDYEPIFKAKIAKVENVNYRGMLNFTQRSAYDTLASYHVMLFPTYWRGEGFAGIFIDAHIAGLPLIATDWAHNKAILGDNAYYIPPRDGDALTKIMKEVIEGKMDLDGCSRLMQSGAQAYDTAQVITKNLLNEINL